MTIHRLKGVAKLITRGMYNDGGGLYLQVSGKPNKPARSWIFRYETDGREHQMGLGSLDTIGLDEARDLAHALRRQRLQGIDPLAARRADQAAKRATAALSTAQAQTFGEATAAYAAAHAAGWGGKAP
jgi:hypothetical protein